MKTKRIFALILTIAMALSLAACGTKETTPSDDGQNPTEQTDPNKISTSSQENYFPCGGVSGGHFRNAWRRYGICYHKPCGKSFRQLRRYQWKR